MMLVSFRSHAKLCYLLTGTVSVKSEGLRMSKMNCLISSFPFFIRPWPMHPDCIMCCSAY
uniref:Uncharacterized protein n=1 Tax=Arundo donax TaxID=35708 RepID=A0A0A9FPH2_ARUDO